MAKAKAEFRPITNTPAAEQAREATEKPPRLKVIKRGVERVFEPETHAEYERLKRKMRATAEGMRNAKIDFEALEEHTIPQETKTEAGTTS